MIAYDWDEVIAPLLGPHCNFLNKKYDLNLREEQFATYNWWDYYPATIDQAIKDLDEFCATDEFKAIRPYPDAIKYLPELLEIDEGEIVSSRPEYLRQGMTETINLYFSGKIKNIYLDSHLRERERGPSKRERCKMTGAGLIIEDVVKNAIDLSKDIPVILVDRPWNQNLDKNIRTNIYRSKNWKETIEIAKKLKECGYY